MSAINVIWRYADGSLSGSRQPAMLAALQPYGRDRQYSWCDNQIALGINLSGFLPEDRFDAQPLWSHDRSVCLIADVRLDNRADLARELSLTPPEELADSAFLMAAWQRWGIACLDHLVGGFAFAVWTPARQELVAVRDHAGERPLFYHRGKDFFALASMPQGLFALPEVPRGFQESTIVNWLAGLQMDRTETFFAGVDRLPPGHFLRVTPGTFERVEYWHPKNARPTRYKRDEEYAEALLEIFDRATEARLRSTGAVGSFLSSGLDSSSVTASAARLLAGRGERLTAFTSVPMPGFNGLAPEGYVPDERDGATDVARLYSNIDHVLIDSQGYDLMDTMRMWTDAWDCPAPNPYNALWITATFHEAQRRGISVMLAGDFGNGAFSWLNWSILGYLFQRGRWIKLASTVSSLRSHGAISFKTAVRYSTQSVVPRALTRKLISRRNRDVMYFPLVSSEWIQRNDLHTRVFDRVYTGSSDPMREHAELFEYWDVGSFNAVVPAVVGLEMRDPTADKRLIDFCFSIPPEQYFAEGHSRSLARRSMKGRLPDSIRLRYPKGLQSADWYLVARESQSELAEELDRIEQSPYARQALDLPRVRNLLSTFPASGYEDLRVRMLWNSALTYAISMGYFLRSREAAFAASAADAQAPLATPLV